MEKKAHRENMLGPRGWAFAGRYGPERYLYLLHRVTGLGLLSYLIIHIFVTASRLYGPGRWETTMKALEGPLFTFLEFVVFAAFVFHGLNGLRLVLAELGLALGRPGRPVYPYVTAGRRQRPLTWVMMALAVFILLVSGLDFLIR